MSNTCTVADITRDVRILMDMNGTDNALAGLKDTETLEINDIIKKNIETAVRDIMSVAPARLLGDGTAMTDETRISWTSKSSGSMYMGRIALPSDFFRLITFKMEGWRNAVTQPIGDDNPLYDVCHSEYSGISGNPDNPVVAIVAGDSGGQTLEFFSCETGTETIERGRYVTIPKITGVPTETALPFDEMMPISQDSIKNETVKGPRYSAVYNTNTNKFVFLPKKDEGMPGVLEYFANCIDSAKYNDTETVRKNQLFICKNKIYMYDETVGGIKAIADSISEYIEIPRQLYDAVIHRIAYLSYLVLGDADAAGRMSNTTKEE